MKKKFGLIFLAVAALLLSCDKNEYDKDSLDHQLQIVGYDSATSRLLTFWPQNNSYDTVPRYMYDERYFEPSVRDFIYARDVEGRTYITGIIDMNTKTIIGWEDANGDDQSYERHGTFFTIIDPERFLKFLNNL